MSKVILNFPARLTREQYEQLKIILMQKRLTAMEVGTRTAEKFLENPQMLDEFKSKGIENDGHNKV